MVTLSYLFKESKHETIKAAFKVLHEKLHNEKTLSEQMLTAVWIESHGTPLFFNNLREMAHNNGWLTEDGKLTY